MSKPACNLIPIVSYTKEALTHKGRVVVTAQWQGDYFEVRDAIEMLVLKMEPRDGLFQSDYVQLMQYLMRFMDKNGVEDLKKARWYLDKMISAY